MSAIPRGWARTTLEQLVAIVMGQAPAGTDCNKHGDGVPFVKAGEFGDPRPVIREWTTKPLKYAREGDVLICVVGATCGKINLGADCAIGRSVAAVRPTTALDQTYLFAFLKTLTTKLRAESVGSAQGVISSDNIGRIEIPLPPAAEQRRIVAKIDRLSTRSKRARDELERVKSLAARAKRSVLAAAFSGRLAPEFDFTQWRQVDLQEIADIQTGITLGKKRSKDADLVKRPYLRVANVQRGWLNLDEVKEIEVTPQEARRLTLYAGDILMNEGGDRDKLGRGWVWGGEIDGCIHQNHVFRVRLHDRNYPAVLISLYANEFGQEHFFDQGKQTTNLASISKAKISTLPMRLPPVAEAFQIVRRIEHAFAAIDRLAAEAQSARALLDKLDQAILTKAFRGELVPQDPNDELASVLLDRIRTERAAAPAPRRRASRAAT